MRETQKPQRETKQRREVLNAVMSRCDHPTVDDIYLQLHEINPKISKGTVYRNLNLLSENNEITHVRVPGADRYDSRLDSHYHVYCICCGNVVDAPIDYSTAFDELTESETGFSINRHRMIFEGICPECRKEV